MMYELCNLRKIKISIKPRHESRKRDKEFGQWRVNVHEISRLDVSRSKFSKVDFVESGGFFLTFMNGQLS
jgi:hypothetical protein